MKKKIYPLEGFADRLRNLWIASGKTQKEIAEQIGITRGTFESYIYADVMPNAFYLARICIVFNVSADYLLFGKQIYGRDRKGSNEGGTEKRDK